MANFFDQFDEQPSEQALAPPEQTAPNPMSGRSMGAYVQKQATGASTLPQGLSQRATEAFNPLLQSWQKDGLPVTISSGYRDPITNAKVGGANGSEHLRRNAIDIPLKGMNDEQKQRIIGDAQANPMVGGFGYYPKSDSIHLDVREGGRAAWGQNYSRTSIGQGWPEWMTKQTQDWHAGRAVAARQPPQALGLAPEANAVLPPNAQQASGNLPSETVSYEPGQIQSAELPPPSGGGNFFDQFDEQPGNSAASIAASLKGASAPLAAGPGAVERALEPLTTYPETYAGMNAAGRERMASGTNDISAALAEPHSAAGGVKFAKGIGNTALGAVEYVASPINAALRTIVGKPVEDATGIPKEYTEFATSLGIPGIGLTKGPSFVGAAPKAVSAGDTVVQAANRIGVDVPRAVASDSNLVQQAGAGLRNVPFAGTPLIKSAEKTVAQLGDKASEVAAGYGGGTVQGSGETARSGLNNYISTTTSERAAKLYDKVDNLVDGSKTVPLEVTSGIAREIMTRRAAAGLGPDSRAVGMVMEATQRPGGLTYNGLKDLRSAVGELNKGGILPEGMSAAELKQIYGGLSDDLRVGVRVAGGPQASAAFERANRYYALVSERRAALAKIIGKDGNAPAEQVFDRLQAMASSTSRADVNKLSQARKAMGAEDWNDFASGIVAKMGRDPAAANVPEAMAVADFSPQRFLTAYGKLTPAGKTLLFRSAGKEALAGALDDIATVSTRFKELQKYSNPSGTARNVGFGAIGAGLMTEPLTTLSTVIGGRGMAAMLAKPATAAAAARWTRDYERLALSPSTKRVAMLEMASGNLATNLKDMGITVNPLDFLKAIQGPVRVPAQDEQQ